MGGAPGVADEEAQAQSLLPDCEKEQNKPLLPAGPEAIYTQVVLDEPEMTHITNFLSEEPKINITLPMSPSFPWCFGFLGVVLLGYSLVFWRVLCYLSSKVLSFDRSPN